MSKYLWVCSCISSVFYLRLLSTLDSSQSRVTIAEMKCLSGQPEMGHLYQLLNPQRLKEHLKSGGSKNKELEGRVPVKWTQSSHGYLHNVKSVKIPAWIGEGSWDPTLTEEFSEIDGCFLAGVEAIGIWRVATGWLLMLHGVTPHLWSWM